VKLELTSQEIEALKRYQRQTVDKSVYAKVTCILMLSKGLSPETVSQRLFKIPVREYRSVEYASYRIALAFR
jgi:hypothetical protein